jgi:flagellar biosynthesis/type III secretory pathway protein FliH
VLSALDPAGRPIELVADATVSPGGCVVDAGSCTIDGSVDAALARVREVLAP